MKFTLLEFIIKYKPKTIQLLYSEHIVNIDTKCKGSLPLIEY